MKTLINKLVFLFVLLFISCQSGDREFTETFVDNLTESDSIPHTSHALDTGNHLNVAVSAMISPKETMKYYEELFSFISHKLNYDIEFKQRRTYQEVNQLLAQNMVDMAFVCSGAYIIEKENSNIEILAVPVCNGKPLYQAYVIVNRSSGISSFEELQGKTFAYTDPLSNTGKLYADKRVKELGFKSQDFFSKTLYSNAHDISMQLVSKKVVEGATIDGLIFDYIKEKYPEKVENLSIIEKSEFYGIPPVVVPSGIEPNIKEKLREIFLNLHNDSLGKIILDELLIDKFVLGNDEDYDNLRECRKFVINEKAK